MTKIERAKKEKRPLIALPITGKTEEEIIRQARSYSELPCDILEWRADYMLAEMKDLYAPAEYETLAKALIIEILVELKEATKGLPVIFTIRTIPQGGTVELSEALIDELTETAAASGAAEYVDLEIAGNEELMKARVGAVKSTGAKALISFHNFESMPAKEYIEILIKKMSDMGGDVCKMAAMANSPADTQTMFEASVELDSQGIGPLIMIAMGEYGEESRIMGGAYGSMLTFASAEEATAPGQIEINELKKILDERYCL